LTHAWFTVKSLTDYKHKQHKVKPKVVARYHQRPLCLSLTPSLGSEIAALEDSGVSGHWDCEPLVTTEPNSDKKHSHKINLK